MVIFNLFYMEMMKDEHIVYETRIDRGMCIFLIFIGIVTLVLIFGIFFILVGVYFLKTKIILTNKRFIVAYPFSTKEIRIDKIESVQTRFKREVTIHGTGIGKMKVNVVDGITLVEHIHKAIDSLKK